MKFSDNIIRDAYSKVYVTRDNRDTKRIEEDEISYNFEFVKNLKGGKKLYSAACEAVKIGESIYDECGNYLAYRSE